MMKSKVVFLECSCELMIFIDKELYYTQENGVNQHFSLLYKL